MRYLVSSRLVGVILGVLSSVWLVNGANAQLIFSKKEVERQHATQWLLTKRYTPVYPYERVQRYVRCVATDLIAVLGDEWQDLNWEVIVFDDDTPNASVLLGGKVSVNSGILKIADTPDALAAVLGHELAHLTEGHVMARTRQASRTSAAAIIGSAATGINRSLFEQGAMIGMQLPFQRAQESEADEKGLEYMARAGYDPRAGVYLWENMKAATDPKGRPPEWMSTHPREDERMEAMIPLLVPNLKLYNEAHAEGRIPTCRP